MLKAASSGLEYDYAAAPKSHRRIHTRAYVPTLFAPIFRTRSGEKEKETYYSNLNLKSSLSLPPSHSLLSFSIAIEILPTV